MRKRLILHTCNFNFCIISFTQNSEIVELDVTFHNKLHFMEHFCVAILEPEANYVIVASHFTYK